MDDLSDVRCKIRGLEKRHLLGVFIAIAAVSTGLLAVTGLPDLDRSAERPPIVLVSIDTFRADRLSAAGYERNITPNLDSFANKSYYFERTYANAPWTLPSHSTVFTGKYPSSTGALNMSYKICDREKTIPERLGEKGYRTAAFTGDGPVSKYFGFRQGFDRWNEQDFNVHKGNVPKSINFIENRPDDRFFLFVHGFDVHSPYVAESRPPKYGGNFSDNVIVTREELEEVRENNRSWVDMRNELNTSRGSPYLRQLEDLYDNSFIPMDRSLGRLFDSLKEEGVYDDALIIVMSDHGEEFREHGTFGHTQMYEETIRVPLIVKFPGQKEGATVKEPVELRDIYPTIMSEAGINTENRGIPLQDIIENRDQRQYVFAERRGPNQRMIVKDGYKLIWNVESGHTEVYNLEKDPEERNNLAQNQELVESINQSFEYPPTTEKRCMADTKFNGPDYDDQ